MVTATSSSPGLLQRIGGWLRDDLLGLFDGLAGSVEPEPGLHTHRIELPGGEKRLHLRVGPDGSGVLFVDVTEVVHLNRTATTIASCALRGWSEHRTRSYLRRRMRTNGEAPIGRDVRAIYEMVERFGRPDGDCPTCAIDVLKRNALFSTPVEAPYKVDIALTYGCNNECPHCYNEADRLDMPSLPSEQWQRVLDRIVEIGVPHIIFTGGEATLHPELPALIRYANERGPIVGLNTNGRRIAHEPYMETLARAGLNHLQVTLGSSRKRVHNAMMGGVSFGQTVTGIKNAVRSNVHVITNTTLMKINRDHVEEIIDFLHDLGIRTFAMNGMIYSGGGFAHPQAIPEDEMECLLIRVRDHAKAKGMRFLWYTPTEYCRLNPVELEVGAKRCNAGEYSLCIEPNGDVLPCQSYYTSAGNILTDPWEEIWNGELFRSFREREEDPVFGQLPEKCHDCPDLPLCGGGCRIEREARDGKRTAEPVTGGACGGCSSGGCGSGGGNAIVSKAFTGGYVPNRGLIGTSVRTSGVMKFLDDGAETGKEPGGGGCGSDCGCEGGAS